MQLLRRALNGALILVLGFISIYAQGVGSTRGLPDSGGGTHSIQGHVFFPSGRAVDQGIMVKLEGGVTGARRTVTDGSGTFSFNSLPAAEYTIIVDAGPDYDALSESVVIYGTSGGGVSPMASGQMLDLHLVPKGTTAAAEAMFAGVPKDAVENYEKAVQAAHAGNNKKAVELLNSVVASAPKFFPALSDLGTQYLKLNQPQKAAEALKRALELEPNNFTVRLNYGVALMNQKDFNGAEAHLREALKINNAAPTAHMYLGITLLSLSRDEKTKQFYPDRYAEGQKELEAATASGKEEVAMAHRYLGGVYAGNKEYKRAALEIETYLQLQPKAPDAERLRMMLQDLKSKN